MKRSPGPDENTVRGEVRNFITSTFPGTPSNGDLKDEDLLFDSGIIDSLGAMELISFLQERYRINVRDEDLFPENFSSLENIGAFVMRKRNGKTARKSNHR